MSNKPASGGFTLVEAVVAITIFVIGVVGLVQTTLLAKSTSDLGRDTIQVTNQLQEGVEAVRTVRDDDWAAIADLIPNTDYRLNSQAGSTPPWTVSEGTETLGKYIRKFRVEAVRRIDTDGSGTLSAGDKICTGAGCGSFDDPSTRRVTVSMTWGSRTRSLFVYLTDWQ